MESPASASSKAMFWAGWVCTLLPAAMLVMSASMKLMHAQPVVEGMPKSGWPIEVARPLGAIELVSTLLLVIPQTAVLGAILVTGYLGGAIASHVRLHEPFIVPAALGVVIWLGLFLRDARIRTLLPLRRS